MLEGRSAIVSWLSAVLGDLGIVTEHHGHHPEITFTSDTTADGTWYLQDRVIVPDADIEIAGTAFYNDRYRLAGGGMAYRTHGLHPSLRGTAHPLHARSPLVHLALRHRGLTRAVGSIAVRAGVPG